MLELNQAVEETVKGLKERGFESPYLKAFVVARINPLRFQRKATAEDALDWFESLLQPEAQFAPADARLVP